MEQVRLGIIGLGNMGFRHAKSIVEGNCPHLKFVCGSDINPDRLTYTRSTLGEGFELFKDGHELIAAGKCDAVLIATPHYLHPTLAIEAFDKGMHVMSEKPAGVRVPAVREMIRAAEKSGKVFAMMFNQRTNPNYIAIRSLIQSGRLGQIRRIVWIITDWYRTQAYYQSNSWRATWAGEGGGMLLNQCPHQLDLWQWICGLPTTVDARLNFGKWHDIEVEDEACVHVTYENGANGIFIASTGDPIGTNRLEITLSKGKILCENGTVRAWELEEDESTYIYSARAGYSAQTAKEFVPDLIGTNSQHDGVLNNFADAILNGTPLIARGEEGIRALALSNAMHYSAWTGNPVKLPKDPCNEIAEWEDQFVEQLQMRSVLSHIKDVTPTYADSGDLRARYHL